MTQERESAIRSARAYLAQVPTFRAREEARGGGDRFSMVLLQWAGNARRRAMYLRNQLPAQGALF